MKKERRWLKSAIATAQSTEVAMPWTRGARRRPEAMKALPADMPVTAPFKPAAPAVQGLAAR